MQLGIILHTVASPAGLNIELVQEAERLGYASVWAGEAYSSDAVSPIAWVLAKTSKIKAGTGILQIPARTPACAAMTAMTLQALSGNRFLCGLGPSGPQVVEGWHGVRFGKPQERTREYIAVIRQILAREKPLEFHGEYYDIPYTGEGATGLGKPLKSIMHPNPNLPIYTAAIAPAGLRTAGELADGVLPFFMSPEKADLIAGPVQEGMAKAGNSKGLADFDIAPYVRVRIGDDLEACRNAVRPELALYIGGMGARSKNYYNDLAKRMGFEGAAAKVQELFLSGKKAEAAAAVPDALIDETSLVGPKARIRDRLQAWKDSAKTHKVRTLLVSGQNAETLRTLAEAAA